MLRLRRWLLRNPMSTPQVKTARRTRLGMEQLEAREVPAQFTVSLLNPGTGRAGSAGASFSGSGLSLNNASVTADNAADAIRLALSGSVDVSYQGESTNYVFSHSTSGTDPNAHNFAYRISQSDAANDPAAWTVGLEDLSASNMQPLGVDWDYDDRFWDVSVTEVATPVLGDGTGLLARYFDEAESPNLGLIRVDAQVNNNWNAGSPDPGIAPDHFKATWNGEILAAYTQTYKFTTVSDDGVRLWVNGQLLVDNWTDHGEARNSGSIPLYAGQKYDIRMEYYENGGQAVAKLLWSGQYQTEEAVPQSYLYPDAPPTPTAGTGTGLLARYFNGSDDPNLGTIRVDSRVDNDWGGGSPDATIEADHFRATWNGQVQAPFDGPFTFSTLSDDGVRLWIDGNLVIDNWTDHGPTRNNSGTVTLAAGEKYDIRLEYYENGGGAVAKLFWASPDLVREVIPTKYLYPSEPPTPVAGSGTGLDATYFADRTLTTALLNRVDPQVNNTWGGGSPDVSVSSDNFSVRWKGYVQAPFDGPFTFSTVSDDGVRLWVNGQLVIDNWSDHGSTRNKSGTIELEAGAYYSVTMEYYERGGDAVAQLEWASPDLIRGLIPQQYLYPVATVPTVSVSASTDGAEGGNPGTFTLTRTGGDLSQPLTAWFTLGGTASNVWDYNVIGATYDASRDQYRVTFPASSTGSPTSVVVTLPTVDGDCPELDETVELTVVNAPGYVTSTPQRQRSLTIIDNDVTLDMVAPGKTWTDGSSVEVFNPGDTWLRASIVSSGWVRLSPVACGETGPAIQNDYFAVVSGLNGFDGDTTWMGDVGGLSLSASGDIHDVTLATTVYNIVMHSGRVSLDAGQGIGNVNVGDVVSLKAAGTVGDVTAKWSVGDISAQHGIGDVRAVEDSVTGDIVSIAGSVGNVTAAHDIRGDVTAFHNLGNVRAGNQISGTIAAGGNIASITVGETNATAATPLPETGGLDTPLWVVDEAVGVYAWGSLPANSPGYGVSSYTVAGLTGEVHAGGNIGSVVVFGQISRSVTAGGTIGTASSSETRSGVWAQGAVGGAIAAGAGDLTVRSWSTVDGSVSAPGAVEVWGYADVTGSVASTGLTATVGSWGDVTGGVTAPGLVDVRALGLVGQDSLDKLPTGKLIESTEDAVQVWSGDVVASPVAAHNYVAVYGRNGVRSDGKFKAIAGDVSVTSAYGDVSGGSSLLSPLMIEAGRNVEVTAGGDIVGIRVAAGKDVTLSADRSVFRSSGEAENNLWVAAKDGDLDGVFVATEGWAYVWAKNDLTGSATAKGMLEATAGRDMASKLTSSDDGVSATVGRDVLETVTGAYWVDVRANGDVNGEVLAGSDTKWASAVVQAGGDILKNVTSSGYAWLSAAGNVSADAKAGAGGIEVTANKDILGNYNATEEITLWAGGVVGSQVNAGYNVTVIAGADIGSRGGITSTEGMVTLRSGRDVFSSVSAKHDVKIEAVGGVRGELEIKSTDGNVSVLSNNSIEGTIRAKWTIDAKATSKDAVVTSSLFVSQTPASTLTDADSAIKKRLDKMGPEPQAPAAGAQNLTPEQIERNALKAQAEYAANEAAFTTDTNHIPADRIRAMIADGLAIEYDFGTVEGKATNGLVGVASVVGDKVHWMLLVPMHKQFHPYEGENAGPGGYIVDESLVGYYNLLDSTIKPSNMAEWYKVIRVDALDIPGEAFQQTIDWSHTATWAKARITTLILQNKIEVDGGYGSTRMALGMVPIVGTALDFYEGNYVDGTISLIGDVGIVFGGAGLLLKGTKCAATVGKVARVYNTASIGLEAGAGGVRVGQGIMALSEGNNLQAGAYFGEAFLRLFGVTAQQIAFMKGKCLAAGTPVQTESGPVAVEDVRAGDRVWAYDRVAGQWSLATVTAAVSRGVTPVVRVTLADGSELVGTPGHPILVVDGEKLAERSFGELDAGEEGGSEGWVGLASVRVGDVVATRGGPVGVMGVSEAGEASVYTITVGGLHCYAAGAAGVVVHNATVPCGPGGPSTPPPSPKPAVSATPAVGAPGVPTAPKPIPASVPPSGDLAKKISDGHSFNKHVILQGEYPGITSKPQFGKVVQDTIEQATHQKPLANGRYAWWDDNSKTVVIYNPKDPDSGTAFRPAAGKVYYDNLK